MNVVIVFDCADMQKLGISGNLVGLGINVFEETPELIDQLNEHSLRYEVRERHEPERKRTFVYTAISCTGRAILTVDAKSDAAAKLAFQTELGEHDLRAWRAGGGVVHVKLEPGMRLNSGGDIVQVESYGQRVLGRLITWLYKDGVWDLELLTSEDDVLLSWKGAQVDFVERHLLGETCESAGHVGRKIDLIDGVWVCSECGCTVNVEPDVVVTSGSWAGYKATLVCRGEKYDTLRTLWRGKLSEYRVRAGGWQTL